MLSYWLKFRWDFVFYKARIFFSPNSQGYETTNLKMLKYTSKKYFDKYSWFYLKYEERRILPNMIFYDIYYFFQTNPCSPATDQLILNEYVVMKKKTFSYWLKLRFQPIRERILCKQRKNSE